MEEFNYFRHFHLFDEYKLAIYVETEEEMKEFLSYIAERGYHWGGEPAKDLLKHSRFSPGQGTRYYCAGNSTKRIMFGTSAKPSDSKPVVHFKGW